MNHIDIQEDKDCCGCGSCMCICPQNAIQMCENSEGFKYPVVDEKKCINCGLCKKACPIISTRDDKGYLINPICYGAKIKDKTIQKKSSSGGAFYGFASYILNKGGVVVGAAMLDDLSVKHIMIEDINKLEKIMGSKYTYSDLDNIYFKIKEKLNEGKKVLFSGLPCQTFALKRYLNKDYENLYLVDIICHGTPSKKLFDKYIEYFQKKNKCKIVNYEFRNKEDSCWGDFKALITINKNNKIEKINVKADFDKYYYNFLSAKGYRESCYVCKFASSNRYSDITIGDFWGIEKIDPTFMDTNGVSEIIINTEKGKELFDSVKNKFNLIETQYATIAKYNHQLLEPSKRDESRNDWYKNIDNDRYFKNKKINKKIILKAILPYKLKLFIKSKGKVR